MTIAFREDMNRGRFETWTERPSFEFHQVHQVHGIEISTPNNSLSEADGMMSTYEKLDRPLAIKTADCLPVVIEGAKGVVHLHAGWRGLAGGILRRKEVAQVEPQRVLIGPCIHSCCFEVSPDFKGNFPGSEFFSERDGKLWFDLTLEAKKQLQNEFPNLLVEIAPVCTCCDLKLHSYRRDKTKERNWNIYIKG